MAKKQKRNVASNRPAAQRPAAQRPAPAERAAASTERAAAAVSSSTRSSYNQEFSPDYSLVIQDLKKIGIMAVSFISLLVVLSFFLR